MRAAAEIEPVALLVDLDLLVLRDGVDQFDLEQLALVLNTRFASSRDHNLLGEGFCRAR